MAAWVCMGCRCVYGRGQNKPKNGYCDVCWNVWLAQCRLNAAIQARDFRRDHVAQCEAAGVVPKVS